MTTKQKTETKTDDDASQSWLRKGSHYPMDYVYVKKVEKDYHSGFLEEEK